MRDPLVTALVDNKQNLSVFDWLAILYADRFNRSRYVCFDLIHHFHGFDDAQRVTLAYTITDLYEIGGTGRRR